MLEDNIEKRCEISRLIFKLTLRNTLTADSVHYREITLRVVGAELEKELKHCLLSPCRVGSWFVDLVDDNDRQKAKLKRLLKHESCLRHWALLCVDHQKHRVDRAQYALNL